MTIQAAPAHAAPPSTPPPPIPLPAHFRRLCSMYAALCERIARNPIAGLGEDPSTSKGSKKFRKMLLLRCHDEFQKDWPGLFVAIQVT